MTEAEIIEANKVIAPFDGWERVYPGNAPKQGRALAQFQNKDGRSIHNFIPDGNGENMYPAFNKDWNLLMPVIEKIQSMGYSVELGNNHYCCICLFEKDSFEGVYFSTEVDPVKGKVTSKIMGAFLVVHQFIQCYNTQSINKPS